MTTGNLSLKRRLGESIRIGEAVVTVERIRGGQVTLRTVAPKEVRVLRTELETEAERPL